MSACSRAWTATWLATLTAVLSLGCNDTFAFDRARDAAAPRLEPCEQDTDCMLATLHCETASGACIECLEDDHCTNPDFARCDPGLRRCVECLDSGDCDAAFICEPRTHSCVRGCTASDDCPNGMDCDQVDGFCESCEERSDCASTPLTPACEPRVEICVQCVSNIDCASPSSRCDPVRARCVACVDSNDCPFEHPFCDPLLQRCVDGAE